MVVQPLNGPLRTGPGHGTRGVVVGTDVNTPVRPFLRRVSTSSVWAVAVAAVSDTDTVMSICCWQLSDVLTVAV